MKTKFLLILLAVFLPLSASVLNADELPHKQDIPLYPIDPEGSKDIRSQIQHPIECHYLGMINAFVTTVWSDLGDVTLTVTNCSTGSVWYDSFNSSMESQAFLAISGEPGTYKIIYITESGGIYKGALTIY